MQSKLDGCATGARLLDASIKSLDRTNPVITTVLAARNRIQGEARLTDMVAGKEVGVYQIGHTVIGGKIGILAMGQAEKQLSTTFGAELCRQAFSKKEPTASVPGVPRGS